MNSRMAVPITFGAFLLGGVAGYCLSNLGPAARPLLNAHEIAAELAERGLTLHYVEDDTCNAYLSTSPRPLDELLRLKAAPEYAADWKGVVMLLRTAPGLAPETADWGDFHWWASGNLLVYGDPALVQRIRKMCDA